MSKVKDALHELDSQLGYKVELKVKKLDEKAVIPSYAKPGDAGLDLTATSVKRENERIVYGTGLAIEIPKGYVGLIFPRSSINKYDLRLTNCVGVIDSGYRGEIKFVFENDSMQPRRELSNAVKKAIWDEQTQDVKEIEASEYIKKLYSVGDRIGQLIVMPYPEVQVEEVEELSNSDRGKGGFGSSGR